MADPTTERPYRHVQWLISNRDFQEHAFHHAADTYLEALCEHSVPPEQIVRAEDTVLSESAPKCRDCLIKYGQLLPWNVQKWNFND